MSIVSHTMSPITPETTKGHSRTGEQKGAGDKRRHQWNKKKARESCWTKSNQKKKTVEDGTKVAAQKLFVKRSKYRQGEGKSSIKCQLVVNMTVSMC